jgi:hypothetical protein
MVGASVKTLNQIENFNRDEDAFQEEWQAKVARLQQLVCALLLKNQSLRMQLFAEREMRSK